MSSPPLNILHAVLSLECGGLERLVLHLCREGVAAGDRVGVLCLDSPGRLADQVRSSGAEVISLDRGPGLMSLSEARRLRRTLRAMAPDVIHSHQMGAALYVGTTALTMRGPAIVHTEHGNHNYRILRQRLLGLVAFRSVDQIYCVSQEIADNLAKHRLAPRNRMSVQVNGIPLPNDSELQQTRLSREQLGIDRQATIYGTIGRLAKVKRQERLLHAIAALARKGRKVHLVVVGDGAERRSLEQQAEQLGIGQLVHFAGFQRDPMPYISLLDVFVLTSDSEGMPMALLEAWSARKPVVVTAVGGLPELVSDGETGLLLPAGDHERLVDALDAVATDAELRKRLGEAGHSLVTERYSMKRVADAYRTAYLSLLRRRRTTCASC